MARRKGRVDAWLHYMQRRGTSRGVFGASRGWFWVAVTAFGLRRLRRAIGSEYDTVFRGDVRPGETIVIRHRDETYAGKRVRSRRRKIRA